MDRAPHSVQDLISIHPDPAGTVADLLVREDQDLTVRALVRRTQDQDHTVRAPAHRTQDRDNTVQPRVPDLMARHRDNTVRGPQVPMVQHRVSSAPRVRQHRRVLVPVRDCSGR
ncbi:hypothetical protein CXR26_04415 [Brevibacterium aurantiacum]|nr:hypothetical protein CXR26_04415 [Brevibacterium aurantiacum]